MTILRTFEAKKGKGIVLVEELYFGGQDIRYRLLGSEKILSLNVFFDQYQLI